jgi:transcription elongation GreA/GreB family factor
MKDFPETLKKEEFKATLSAKLTEMLNFQEITDAQELQLHFFLEDLSSGKNYKPVSELIKHLSPVETVVHAIDILAFKKRTLVEVRKLRADWEEIFLNMLFTVDQAPLRDYLLGELVTSGKSPEALKKKLEELSAAPQTSPDVCLWYFQKIMNSTSLPFSDKKGKIRFFEAFLVLLSCIEQIPEERDMVKKMHALLSAGRYAIVREIMQGSRIEDVKEFLLLATKCHSLSDHDIKILHSLGEVVHPSLGKSRKKESANTDTQVIWTTQSGHDKLKARIEQIATVETVETAKEIETARGHGDLKENAEFKAALEKRDRLQSELKLLSDQLNRSRVMTKEDVVTSEVGVGTVVDCKDKDGKKVTYTLLGPWDADPEKNILSFQSKLAQTMKGLKVGDSFQFQGEELTITAIRSHLK